MKTLNEIIRELREDNDMTQKQIAELLNTTQQVYSRYETGENELPVHHLITLAKFYKTSTDFLLGLTSERKSYPFIE
jgi:Predicted transcriptional regulator